MITVKNTYGETILTHCAHDSFVGAKFHGEMMPRADLSYKDLTDTCFVTAYLYGADLRYANFDRSDLRCATMRRADLRGADLSGANLKGAELEGAIFNEETILPDFQIPQDKDLIVWKKLCDGKIAKLLIKKEWARTASLIGNKCRAERALVLEIRDPQGRFCRYGYSIRSKLFAYRAGSLVSPEESYDGDIRVECTSGIHFFITREEAKDYCSH